MSIIKISNLTKLHSSGKIILNNISTEVKEREVVGIIGPSGSGKTTLLRCINYMDPPNSGSVFIDGEEVTSQNECYFRACKVGMVFQHFNLFSNMNIIDNIAYAPQKILGKSPEEAMEEAEKLLLQVGMKEYANVYPHNLSGGQKQRIAIARSLAMHPKVILFDEPTSALDPENIKEVLEVLMNVVKDGITILIVSHALGILKKISNRIWFLENGELLEDKPADEFFNFPENDRVKNFLQYF